MAGVASRRLWRYFFPFVSDASTLSPHFSPITDLLMGCSDYHVHTPLCQHATGWPTEFAARAVNMGLGELGFADHNPMPSFFDDWRMPFEHFQRYLDEVQKAREAYPALTIRLGLECDYLPGWEFWIEKLAGMAEWDFFIGSVHYLPQGWDVDNPRHMSRHMQGGAEAIWKDYWSTYEKAIRSGLFDFVGHPDLPKKFGFKPEGDLRRFYEPSITALKDCNMAFEINTSGLRKQCQEIYPSPQFVEMAHEAGVPVLVNSDAHMVRDLCADFRLGVELARNAGYSELARFDKRRRFMVPMPTVALARNSI